jgi:hypothetical protein
MGTFGKDWKLKQAFQIKGWDHRVMPSGPRISKDGHLYIGDEIAREFEFIKFPNDKYKEFK